MASWASALLLVTACAKSTNSYLLPDIEPLKAHSTVVRTVEVTRFDLPAYAEDNQISVLGEDGIVRPMKDAFWADAPDRALTEVLSGGLDQAISASVVSEPWPFEQPAEVKVEMKVRDLIASESGTLRLSGQYSLSSPAGGDLMQSKRFDFSAPVGDGSLTAISMALASTMRSLTQEIASQIARVSRSQIDF